MKPNVHPYDRIIRIAMGLGVLSMMIAGPRSPWFLLGLVPFLTGTLGICPLYAVLGISGARQKR